MDGIAEYPQGTVLQRILRIRPAAKAAEQKVYRHLVSDYPMAGLVPVVQLAAQAEVSTATVLRVVGKLGFSGYAAFQSALRKEVAARLFSPGKAEVDPSAYAKPLDQTLLQLAQSAAINSVKSTLARIPEDDLSQLVSLLADPARSIFIVGGQFSEVLASHLGRHLTILRPSVRIIGAEAADGLSAMLDVNRRALFVVFEFRRYQPDMFSFISRVKGLGATIVLFTDEHLSPVAGVAEYAFVFNTSFLGRFDSLVSAHVTVDLLIHLVFDRIGQTAQRRVEMFEQFRRLD